MKIVNESISKNENRINANETCEIYMNDIMEETYEENPNLQAKRSKNPKGQNEQDIKYNNIKNLHVQRKYWKPHGRTLLCWAFYCVNDNTHVDLENTQIMCFVFCHKNVINAINPRAQTNLRQME